MLKHGADLPHQWISFDSGRDIIDLYEGTRAKGFASFCPIGPWIVTDLDVSDLEIRCEVGRNPDTMEVRQIGRTKDIGRLPLEDMLDLGVTGPMLRAAGLKVDARKDEPYTSYEKFDFDIPTRTENDVYARYQVRIEEMRQSARIVRQALEGMPAGPWKADAPHVVLPDRGRKGKRFAVRVRRRGGWRCELT